MCVFKLLVRHVLVLFVAVFTAVVFPFYPSYNVVYYSGRYVKTMALTMQWEAVQPMETAWQLDADLVALIDEAYMAATHEQPELIINDEFWLIDSVADMSAGQDSAAPVDPGDSQQESTSQQVTSDESERQDLRRRRSPRIKGDGNTASGTVSPQRTGEGDVIDTAVDASVDASGSASAKVKTKRSASVKTKVGQSAPPGESELLPLRPKHEEYMQEVDAALKREYPNKEGVTPANANWNVDWKHKKLDRDGIELNESHMEVIRAKNANKPANMPDYFKPSFKIYDWGTQLARFDRVRQKAGHLEWMDQNDAHCAMVPLAFDRALALTANYFVENIMHLGKTYAAACRHITLKYDTHPWCIRCYILSPYQPCVSGSGCPHCAELTAAVAAKRDKLMVGVEAWSIRKAAEKHGSSALPRRIIFQFDSHLLTLLNATSPTYAPFEAILTLELGEYFHVQVTAGDDPPVETGEQTVSSVSPVPKKRSKVVVTTYPAGTKADAVDETVAAVAAGAGAIPVDATRKYPRRQKSVVADYSDSFLTVSGTSVSEKLVYDRSSKTLLAYDPVQGPTSARIVNVTTPSKVKTSRRRASHSPATSTSDTTRSPKLSPGLPKLLNVRNSETGQTEKVELERLAPNLPFPWRKVATAIVQECGVMRVKVQNCPDGAFHFSADKPISKHLLAELEQVLLGDLPVRIHPFGGDIRVLAICEPDHSERINPPVIYEAPIHAKRTLFTGDESSQVLGELRTVNLGAEGDADTSPDIKTEPADDVIVTGMDASPSGKGDPFRTPAPPPPPPPSSDLFGKPSDEQTPSEGAPSEHDELAKLQQEATAEALSALGTCDYSGQRTLDYLPVRAEQSSARTVFATQLDLCEIQEEYDHNKRESMVLLDVGTTEPVDWKKVENASREELALLLRNYYKGGEKHAGFFRVHTPGWYGRVAAMRFQAGKLHVDADWPMILRRRRPREQAADHALLADLSIGVGPRLCSEWNGLSPLAQRFLEMRCKEYANSLQGIAPVEMLAHTYTSMSAHVHTERYMAAEEPDLPLRALGAPEQSTWKDQLTGVIDKSFCYVVTDQAMRYSEELARLRFYTLAQREYELDRTEAECGYILQMLQEEHPRAYERLRRVISKMMNRSVYGLLDDYAAATEQLCHIVTMRRQGYLSAAPFDLKRCTAALGAPVYGQKSILPS